MLGKDSCSVLLDLNPRGPEAPGVAAIQSPGRSLGLASPAETGEWGLESGARCSSAQGFLFLFSSQQSESTLSCVFCLSQTRLLNSTRPIVQDGWCLCPVANWAHLWQTLAFLSQHSPAGPSLDHDHGVMGLIYDRKPLKAQELCRACDNRHKARI